MNRVLIWDYTGISAQWLDQVADKSDIEVVATMTPKESVPEILLKKNSWDWLLIFEQGMRNFFDTTIQALKLPLEKIVYALDMNSWLQKPKSIFALTNWRGGRASIFLNFNLAVSRQLNDFVTCTVEGLSYIATSKDNGVIREMYTRRTNFAANEINDFYDLTHKYYDLDDSAGYFLDLGANIGTTVIYFLNKFAPKLKGFAFELVPETFKMLRMNLILNDMEDKVTAVNYGLGDKFDEMTVYKDPADPGATSVVQRRQNMIPAETIKIIPLDSYIAENKISAQDVKYIWIDTEGFEPQVILGAKNLIKENPAPIFAEYNVQTWRNSGRMEEMMALLTEYYSHFILFEFGKKTLYPLEDLSKLEPWPGSWTRGDVFLIRKGAIV